MMVIRIITAVTELAGFCNKSRRQPSLSPPRFLEHSPCRRRPRSKCLTGNCPSLRSHPQPVPNLAFYTQTPSFPSTFLPNPLAAAAKFYYGCALLAMPTWYNRTGACLRDSGELQSPSSSSLRR